MRERVAIALREARKAAGYRQKEVARIVGVSAAYICVLETNKLPFPEGMVARLPRDMRAPVRDALIRNHEDAIARLRKLATD